MSKIIEGTLCSLEQVGGIPEERILKKVLKNIPEGKMSTKAKKEVIGQC